MLSMKNGDTLESHLFIAVTDDDVRGTYTCMSSENSDEALQTFIIESKILITYIFLFSILRRKP